MKTNIVSYCQVCSYSDKKISPKVALEVGDNAKHLEPNRPRDEPVTSASTSALSVITPWCASEDGCVPVEPPLCPLK